MGNENKEFNNVKGINIENIEPNAFHATYISCFEANSVSIISPQAFYKSNIKSFKVGNIGIIRSGASGAFSSVRIYNFHVNSIGTIMPHAFNYAGIGDFNVHFVQTIASNAFSNALLEHVTLPDTAVIEPGAFSELNSNPSKKRITHLLSLGVHCQDPAKNNIARYLSQLWAGGIGTPVETLDQLKTFNVYLGENLFHPENGVGDWKTFVKGILTDTLKAGSVAKVEHCNIYLDRPEQAGEGPAITDNFDAFLSELKPAHNGWTWNIKLGNQMRVWHPLGQQWIDPFVVLLMGMYP